MRKITKMLLALLVSAMGATNVFADQLVDLEAEMFKAWSTWEPGASVVAEPEAIDGGAATFGCEYNLYNELGAWGVLYGNSNVYYLWYADITGTKTVYFDGTPGMKLRVQMNRQAPVEGGDAHGSDYVEKIVTIGDDGKGTLDVSSMEYIHVNCIKLASDSGSGIIKKMQIEGTVKAVSGWVDLLNNGDVTGTDLESFPVSKDGPNNGDTANDRPEIVELNGVKCLKVTADDLTAISEGWTTWSAQFYLKLSEALPEGTNYRMEFDVYSSENATITTSAQGDPRKWHAGFIDAFDTWADWQHKEYEGTVTADQGKDGGLGSIAFDLNNSNKPIDFYFKNVHFYIYKEKSPLGQFSAGFQYDVICVDLGDNTNMKALVEAAGGKRIIYPNDCATVKVNGQPTTLLSVEGRADGKLWVFVDEGYSEDEADEVTVSFRNPADEALRLKFVAGRWEGEDAPDFTLVCAYTDGLGENISYQAEAPELVSTTPEEGSFNLPVNLKTFTAVFATEADCSKIVAKLDNETLTASPAEGYAKEVTFTRTADGDIANGEHVLTIDKVYPVSDVLGDDNFNTFNITLNFGPVVIDPDDVAKDILPASYFVNCASGQVPEGYLVNFNGEERRSGNGFGSGPRMFDFGAGGDFTKGLYFREGFTQFGKEEGYLLPLEAGKKYAIHFNSAQWKDNGRWMKFEIFDENSEEAVFSQMIDNQPNVNGSTAAVTGATSFDYNFVPETSGNYTLKWTSTNADGEQGYSEVLLANVSVKYMPNSVGAEETMLLNTALENAKATLEGNAAERYAGKEYSALQALILAVEAERADYTAPSIYRTQAAALDAASTAMKDHRALCDNFDKLPAQAYDILTKNAENLFAATADYANLKAAFDEYATVEERTETVNDDEGNPVENKYLVVVPKTLVDNAELTTAIDELTAVINYTGGMFTQGASKTGTTGYAALGERIRLGVETLNVLGVEATDELIVKAQNTLGDSDTMADALKQRITGILYASLKEADNTLFAEVIDDNTLESTTPEYNMSVFVKNPNLYILKKDPKDLSAESVPGWTIERGGGYDVSWSAGWGGEASKFAPIDATLTNWACGYNAYQEIADLPAGVYSLKAGLMERTDDADPKASETFIYGGNGKYDVENTEWTGDTLHIDKFGQQDFGMRDNMVLGNLVVTDGKLTIGVTTDGKTHLFWNGVSLWLTAPAAGFDYAATYQNVVDAIETEVAQPARVGAIAIYDLNGRRLGTAQKGIQILKKYMSDGTVRVEKVVKK